MKAKTTGSERSREQAYVLLGERRDGLWLARAHWPSRGGRTSVSFDWERVLQREESRGDVVGFLHTHPGFSPSPSARDDRTMESWCISFDKALLCVISSGDDIRAWVYTANGTAPREADRVAQFSNRWLVVTES